MNKFMKHLLIGLTLGQALVAQNIATELPEIPEYMLHIQKESQVPDYDCLEFMYLPRIKANDLLRKHCTENNINLMKVLSEKGPEAYWELQHRFFVQSMKHFGLWDKREQLENYFRIMMFKSPDKAYRQGCFTYFISSGQILTPESVKAINRKLQDPNTEPDFLGFAAYSPLFVGSHRFGQKDNLINRVHFSRENVERLIKYQLSQSSGPEAKELMGQFRLRLVIVDYFNEIKNNINLTEDEKFKELKSFVDFLLKIDRKLILRKEKTIIGLNVPINIVNPMGGRVAKYYVQQYLKFLLSLDFSNVDQTQKNVLHGICATRIITGTTKEYIWANNYKQEIQDMILSAGLKYDKDLQLKMNLIYLGSLNNKSQLMKSNREKIQKLVYNELISFKDCQDLSIRGAIWGAMYANPTEKYIPALFKHLFNLKLDETKMTEMHKMLKKNVYFGCAFAIHKMSGDMALKDKLFYTENGKTKHLTDEHVIKGVVAEWWAQNKEKYPVPASFNTQ